MTQITPQLPYDRYNLVKMSYTKDMRWRSTYWWPVAVMIIVVGVGFGLIVLTQFRTRNNRNTAAQLQVQAEREIADHAYTAALRDLQRALQLDPRNESIYLSIAKVYATKRQLVPLENILAEGVKRVGSDELRVGLIDTLIQQRKYDEASDQVNKLSSGFDQQRRAEFKASLALYQGNVDKAKEAVASFRADTASFEISLWRILTVEQSSQTVGEVVKALPTGDQPLAWQLFSRDWQQVTANDEAKHLYLRTIVARLSANNGYDRMAQKLSDGVTQEAPNYEQAWLLLAHSDLVLGENDAGLAALGKVMESNPSMYEPYWYRARYWVQQDNKAQATADYTSALALADSRNPALMVEWAEQQLAWEQDPSKTWQSVISLAKPDATSLLQAYQGLADYQLSKDQLDAANTTINKGLLDKRLSKALADNMLEAGPLRCSQIAWDIAKNDIGKAKELLDQYIPVYKTTACLAYQRGTIAQIENNPDQAKEDFQRAYDLDDQGKLSALITKQGLL